MKYTTCINNQCPLYVWRTPSVQAYISQHLVKKCSRWLTHCLLLFLSHNSTDKQPGPRLNVKTVFPGMGISMLNIRRRWDRLIFNMGILIVVRLHFYIETSPWSPRKWQERPKCYILWSNTASPSYDAQTHRHLHLWIFGFTWWPWCQCKSRDAANAKTNSSKIPQNQQTCTPFWSNTENDRSRYQMVAVINTELWVSVPLGLGRANYPVT